MGVNNKIRRVTISLDPSFLKIIDEERGLIKRSTYIDDLLRKQLQPILKRRRKMKDEGRSRARVPSSEETAYEDV